MVYGPHFQRRHIIVIGRMLHRLKPQMTDEAYGAYVNEWADVLATSNPRFKRDQFVVECWLGDGTVEQGAPVLTPRPYTAKAYRYTFMVDGKLRQMFADDDATALANLLKRWPTDNPDAVHMVAKELQEQPRAETEA